MAKIIINNENEVNGKLSISRRLVSNDNIEVTGQLATHRYFEEIDYIESERYILTGVKIIEEEFGSNDFDILYTFKAKYLDIKGGETNLPEYVIEEIEKKEYFNENKELIHKEVYTKWKTDMN